MEANYWFFECDKNKLKATWQAVFSGTLYVEFQQKIEQFSKELEKLNNHPDILLDKQEPLLNYSDSAKYKEILPTLLEAERLKRNIADCRDFLGSIDEVRWEIIKNNNNGYYDLFWVVDLEKYLVRFITENSYFAQEGFFLEELLKILFPKLTNINAENILGINHEQWRTFYKNFTKNAFYEACGQLIGEHYADTKEGDWLEKELKDHMVGISKVVKTATDNKTDIITFSDWDDWQISFLEIPEHKQRMEWAYKEILTRRTAN